MSKRLVHTMVALAFASVLTVLALAVAVPGDSAAASHVIVVQGYVYDSEGRTVDEIPLRDWYVLRSSTRRREIVWLPRFALGYYTAQLSISGVGGEPDIRIGAPFWVIPALPVLLAIIAIFGASFLVQIFFSRFEIKKKKER